MSTPVPFGYVDQLGDTTNRLIVFQGNDTVVTFIVTDPNNSNAVVNITGATILLTRKASRLVPDTDPSAKTYTGAVTNGAGGVCTVPIPGADNGVPGVTWWRLDITLNAAKRTPAYGPLEVYSV